MDERRIAGGQNENNLILPGGKYEMRKKAGKGGAGEVFSVYDRRLGKIWAAKRVSRDCPGMEATVLGRMDVEIFPRIVDVVEDTDCRYLIMDWIEGETLQERIAREGPLEIDEGIRIGIALCGAIGALHAMQPPLLYLDCKPSNIMIDKNGKLYLIDFGSALESREAEVMPIAGSFGYGAPEQFGLMGKSQKQGQGSKEARKGRYADERSDIYGVGRTLYALFTGMDLSRPPYGAYRLRECNPAVAPAVAKIVDKCTRELPQERYQTMEAVKNALEKQRDDKSGFAKQLASYLVTCFLLFLTVRHARLFYGIVGDVKVPSVQKLRFLFAMVILAAAAGLWQFYAVEKGYRHKPCRNTEPLQSVIRTQKRAGRWMLAVLLPVSFLFATLRAPSPQKVLAEEPVPTASLPLCLRDEKLRRLLIKNGCPLESGKPVYIELNPALFQTGKKLEIRVISKEENGATREYLFDYLPKQE